VNPSSRRKASEPATRPAAVKAGKCPICGKPQDMGYRPFCSKRCSDIDLGRWLGSRYAVPGEPISTRTEGDDEQ